MFAEKHYPELLLPEELDAYLANGWYRMGQTVFTTHFLCFGDQFYSAIWVRLNIKNYHFRKSLRKIIRKNLERFDISIHPANITSEKERLYARYKASFPGILAPTLRDALLDGEDYNIFDTYEINVYDGNRLIALSYFDKGADSVASITGIYDPLYGKYSLGLFTMLMEIAFCMDNDISYFYPGYVVPGYSRFNYKLRIGNVDYFNVQSGQWENYQTLSQEDIPIERMRRKISELYLHLSQAHLSCSVYYYPLFEANLFGFWKAPYFDYPVFLLVQLPIPSEYYLIVVYSLQQNAYQIIRCSDFDDLQFYFNEAYVNSFDQERYFMELIVVDQILFSCHNKEAVLQTLRQQFLQPSAKK